MHRWLHFNRWYWRLRCFFGFHTWYLIGYTLRCWECDREREPTEAEWAEIFYRPRDND